MDQERKYVFGPVLSRRLGRSLGVDLVPLKTCSFNCVYCQLGQTTKRTADVASYAPIDYVLVELIDALRHDRPDYVTISGSGEPTLHAGLGELVTSIKRIGNTPVAILTNGSLFWKRSVREACSGADVILPTIAAHDEAGYQRVHRPSDDVTFQRHIDGLIAFRNEWATPMWVELFLLEGINTSPADRDAFIKLLERLRPDRIQINTAVRPAAEACATAVSAETLEQWAKALGSNAEVIASVRTTPGRSCGASDMDVLSLCRRHPSTMAEIAAALGMATAAVEMSVERLSLAGALRLERREGREYYLGT